jgi:hypothetical protein
MADQELIVKIGAKIDELKKGLSNAQNQLQEFGKKATSIGVSLSKNVTAPIAAIGAAAFANTVRIGNFADALLDLEQQTGLSTDALQEYRQVTTQAGVATDTIAQAAENLQKRFARGEEGSKDLSDGLAAIGVSAKDASGGLRDIDSILEETITQLADIENVTERNQLAFKIFGQSASALIPVLSLGSKEINNAKQQARDLGLVLSKDALNSANDFRIAFDTLKNTVGGIANEIGIAFIPIANKLVEILQNNVIPVIRNVISFFNNLSPTVKTVIAVVVGLVAALGPLLAGLGFFITTILPALKIGLAAVTALFSPLILKIVAITALVGGLILVGKALVDSWDLVSEFFSQTWDKIKLFFVNGVRDLLIALNKFTSVIGLDFENAIQSLENTGSRIQNGLDSKPVVSFGDVLGAVGDNIKNTFTSIKDSVVSNLSGVDGALESTKTKAIGTANAIKRTFETAIGGGGERGEFGTATIETPTLGIINPDLGPSFGKVIDNIIDQIDTKFPDVIAKIQSFAFDIDNLIRNNIEGSFIDLGNAIGQALAEGQNVFEAIGKTLLNSVGIFLSDFGALLIKYGVAGIAFGKLTKAIATGGPVSIGAGILAIAAGTALVAIGGAIRGLAGRQGGGGGIATSGVGSGVGSSFGGATGGAFDFNRQVELVGEFSVSGQQLKYVIQNSENFEN